MKPHCFRLHALKMGIFNNFTSSPIFVKVFTDGDFFLMLISLVNALEYVILEATRKILGYSSLYIELVMKLLKGHGFKYFKEL